MSKRDIILFDIGRKTTGFSEKNLRESSEPAPLFRLYSIPSQLYPSVRTQNKPVIFWMVFIWSILWWDWASPQLHPLGLDYIWKTPILEYPYMRIILIWPPYNTFLFKCQGFFCPFFSGIFLDISCWTCHTSYVNWEKERKIYVSFRIICCFSFYFSVCDVFVCSTKSC